MTRETTSFERTAERRRWTGFALLAGAALSVLLALFYAHNPVSTKAAGYASTVSAASAGTYVTLRTLNAVLSTAQEVEMGVGLGVSGSAQPLKMLEPIDDTIERIADAVFALMVFSGVLAVAMGPVGAVGFAMMAGAFLLWWLAPGQVLGRRLASYGVFLALALPLSFLLSSSVADHMTREVWEENEAVIARITSSIDTPDSGAEAGWFDRMRSGLTEMESYRTLAGTIFDQADELVASYVAILAVYVFRIFLLPALLAGGFFVAARWLAESGRGLQR
ncbi:hypothetical protein [Sedimentitalea arenosa]|uniref:Uncharacterized protein n=1 Tax=Sedimentitalea arenosa TaxID=2798803 RepID=A0A8J7LWK6_9RHOB|nr:hypothetical protein [Arenibacterium arenosum]MBJ6372351.1 hypothetical protein [Arenibacterium arenosum]